MHRRQRACLGLSVAIAPARARAALLVAACAARASPSGVPPKRISNPPTGTEMSADAGPSRAVRNVWPASAYEIIRSA
jgi:hypothetical protein